MAVHRFTAALDGTGSVVWSPRPQDETRANNRPDILIGDVITFHAVNGSVYLDFGNRTPFEPNQPPARPNVYEAAGGQDLKMTVVSPPGEVFPFDCAIRKPNGTLVGLDKAGDQIPVGN